MTEDTIIALATPPGAGAIGIVRLSGPCAHAVARQLFRSARSPSSFTGFQSARVYHGHLADPGTGELIDEVLVTTFRAPASYTGEDVVEISAHGSPVVLRNLIEACLTAEPGLPNPESVLRLAEPGEFTLRAFLNGKLDLAQAEAVADLIGAQTDLSARAALQQLRGRLGAEIRELQAQLVRLMTHLEASLDFPEDELEPWPPSEQLNVARSALTRIERLQSTYHRGRLLREGMTMVIAGRPNVGKSSLLNALLRRDRAIVTPIPGTTRDTLEELANIKGIPVKAIDTAGLRSDPDQVERLGIERAHIAMAEADLVLIVVDASQPLTGDDESILAGVGPARAVVVRNKCDLAPAWETPSWPAPYEAPLSISALTGAGLADLEDAIQQRALGDDDHGNEPTITRLRHQHALDRSHDALAQTIQALGEELPADLVSIPLRDALHALGEITGENLIESAIHNIFAEFCIGK